MSVAFFWLILGLFCFSFFKIIKRSNQNLSLYLSIFYGTSNSYFLGLCFQPIRLSSFSRLKPLLGLGAITSCRSVIHRLAQLTLSLFCIVDEWTPPVIPPPTIRPEQDSSLNTCSAPVHVPCP
jgi:hypothetical protein